jgi:hypothetical protein
MISQSQNHAICWQRRRSLFLSGMPHMLCRAVDIALAKTINGLFKAEVIHRRGPWRNYEAVEYVTLKWVDYGVVE